MIYCFAKSDQNWSNGWVTTYLMFVRSNNACWIHCKFNCIGLICSTIQQHQKIYSTRADKFSFNIFLGRDDPLSPLARPRVGYTTGGYCYRALLAVHVARIFYPVVTVLRRSLSSLAGCRASLPPSPATDSTVSNDGDDFMSLGVVTIGWQFTTTLVFLCC